MKPAVGLLAALLSLSQAPPAAPRRPPDIRLSVTVQQKDGDAVVPGLHLLTLRCFDGGCELETISINQCSESSVSGAVSFPVVVERTWTEDGSLAVTDEGGVLKIEERGVDIGGSYVSTFRVGYKRSPDRVVSLSGAFVKDSDLLKKVITREFQAVQGAYSERKLDCPVRLPGVEAHSGA